MITPHHHKLVDQYNNYKFTRQSNAYTSDGKLVLPNNGRFEQGLFGKALMVEEGTTNLFTNAQSRCVSGWMLHYDPGIVTWTQNADNEEKIKCIVNTDTSNGNNYIDANFNGLTYQGQTVTFSVDLIVENHTAGTIQLVLYDKQNLAYLQTVTTIPNGNIFGRYSVTRTLRTPLDDSTSSLIPRLLLWGVNAGTIITMSRAQLEVKPYSTTWQQGNINRKSETVKIPLTNITPFAGTIDSYIYLPANIKQLTNREGLLFKFLSSDGLYTFEFKIQNGNIWRLVSQNSNGTTGNNATNTLADNKEYFLRIMWDNTQLVAKWFDITTGSILISMVINNPYFANSFASYGFIGSDGSNGILNAIFEQFRISNIVRTDTPDFTKPLPTDSNTILNVIFDGADFQRPAKTTATAIKNY